ncbi:hypothetical protein FBB35_31740 [Nostoc sp. TCL240-02]|nr:hypothetical protein FBB35_31740 [Nostoc sp. TCL240-02]
MRDWAEEGEGAGGREQGDKGQRAGEQGAEGQGGIEQVSLSCLPTLPCLFFIPPLPCSLLP